MDAGADRTREYVGLVGRDLEVADRGVQQYAVRGRARRRVVGHVMGPAVALAAIPPGLKPSWRL